MKKLRKILLAVSLSFALLLVPTNSNQYEAGAVGMPTIDIANLLQNIMDFLTSLDSFDIDAKTFEKITEKIENFSKYIQMFQQGYQAFTIARDIAEAGMDIANDLIYMKDAAMYFYSIGARPSICIAAGNCFNDFKTLSTDIKNDFDKIITLFTDNKSGAEINLLLELDRFMNEYRAKLVSLSYHFRSRLQLLYQKEMMYRQAAANRDFRKLIVY